MSRPARPGPPEDLESGLRARRPRALARAISMVEAGGEAAERLIASVYPPPAATRVVGVTGPPGAGKSTLVDRMARELRDRGSTVGILAVDPTSPFSGGAILGDRIRMQSLYLDPGVFIRSMATRGAMGGLAAATHDAVDVLAAAGFDCILVETVGVGQDEVDVVRSVDSVLVLAVPGLGDEIQAIKAGIMEIADVFVINKADRDGVERTRRDLEGMLSMAENQAWRPPICETVASRGEGVAELLGELDRHRRWLEESGELEQRRLRQLRLRIENILKAKVLDSARAAQHLERRVEAAQLAGTDPYSLAAEIFDALVKGEPVDG